MSEVQRVFIWPVKTGIQPIPPEALEVRNEALRTAIGRWAVVREIVESREEYQTFVREMRRRWSIFTGEIEGLYKPTRGLTESMIAEGYQVVFSRQDEIDISPEELQEILEAQDSCIDILFEFVKGDRALTVGFIKELHIILTRVEKHYDAVAPDGKRLKVPLEHGEWKRHPNSPHRGGIVYEYCPPEQVASEIERLCFMYEEAKGQGVLPEVLAAWIHHRFTQIHPFADGNGRVARALATLVLIQNRLFPLTIAREEYERYIQALEKADVGDLRPLIFQFARLQRETLEGAISLSRSLVSNFGSAAEAARDIGAFLAGGLELDDWATERMTRGWTTVQTSFYAALETAVAQIRQELPMSRHPQVRLERNPNHAPFLFVDVTTWILQSNVFEDLMDTETSLRQIELVEIWVQNPFQYYFCGYFAATARGPEPRFAVIRDDSPGYIVLGASISWQTHETQGDFQNKATVWVDTTLTAVMNDLRLRVIQTFQP